MKDKTYFTQWKRLSRLYLSVLAVGFLSIVSVAQIHAQDFVDRSVAINLLDQELTDLHTNPIYHDQDDPQHPTLIRQFEYTNMVYEAIIEGADVEDAITTQYYRIPAPPNASLTSEVPGGEVVGEKHDVVITDPVYTRLVDLLTI